jgi:hypothetical protein
MLSFLKKWAFMFVESNMFVPGSLSFTVYLSLRYMGGIPEHVIFLRI